MIPHNPLRQQEDLKTQIERLRMEINGHYSVLEYRPHHPQIHQISNEIIKLEEEHRKLAGAYYAPFS